MGKTFKMKRCKTKDGVSISVHKDLFKKIKQEHARLGIKNYSRTYVTKLIARKL